LTILIQGAAVACSSSAHRDTSVAIGTDAASIDSGVEDAALLDSSSHDTGSLDAALLDASSVDADHPDASAVDARVLSGFIFDGPTDAGMVSLGASYQFLPVGDAGVTHTATVGSLCTSGSDCASLGSGAGCFIGPGGGICARSCPSESDFCTPGFMCVRRLNAEGLCLPTCGTNADCGSRGLLSKCSGPFASFQPPFFPAGGLGCFFACSTDADCNSLSTGQTCNPISRQCADPSYYVGINCITNADCLNLGPGGACLENTRNPLHRYCTAACDPVFTGGCVSGYATTTRGATISVQLKPCVTNTECQVASSNTCNFFPSQKGSFCSILCASDADCPSGACNTATGNCRSADFWSPDCAAAVNCASGICLKDVFSDHGNCSLPCTSDTDCMGHGVCVTAPGAVEPGANDHEGNSFCAPTCAADGGTCSQAGDRCFTPTPHPEIDFRASGSASSNYCWN
jgi:hypothetical protein